MKLLIHRCNISFILFSLICKSLSTTTYNGHRYSFKYDEIITYPYNHTLINDSNILISIINASQLSFLINDKIILNNDNFDSMSYKYKYAKNRKRRRIMDTTPNFKKESSCLKTTANCYSITDRKTCLSSKDGRSNFMDDPCVWCGGGKCTSNKNYQCEPATWLAAQTNKVNEDKFEYAHYNCIRKSTKEHEWKLLLRLKDVSQGYFSPNLKQSGNENEGNMDANTFSILGKINPNDYADQNGKYYFKLVYRYLDKHMHETDLIWKQMSWPTTSSTIQGYEPVLIPHQTHKGKCQEFQGLAKSTDKHTYLDGNGHGGCWFNSVGSNKGWNNGIPAFNGKVAKYEALYIYQPKESVSGSKLQQFKSKSDHITRGRHVGIQQLVTFDDAMNLCRYHYGDMVAVNNAAENGEVNKLCKEMGGHCWLGLRVPEHKKWDEVTTWVNGEKYGDYKNWSPGEPNNWGGKQKCTQLYSSGKWDDVSCLAKRHPICEHVEKTEYDHYVAVAKELTQSQAVEWCKTNYGHSASLAVIKSFEDNEEARKACKNIRVGSNSMECWIGLQQSDDQTFEKWADEKVSSVLYKHWLDGSPKKRKGFDCAIMSVNEDKFGWDNKMCDDKSYFICDKGEGQKKESAKDPYLWIGCYKDTASRAMRNGPKQYGYSIDSCFKACTAYKYFSLQNNGWCSCENDWVHATKYGTSSSCPSSHMGGPWGNDVFEILSASIQDDGQTKVGTKTSRHLQNADEGPQCMDIGWEKVSGGLEEVSVAGDGTVWGTNGGDAIYRRDASRWTRIGGALEQIDVGSSTIVWGVNSRDNIYQRRTDRHGWRRISGKLRHISCASDGSVWGVNKHQNIYRRDGSRWTRINGKLKQIDVGSATNVWGVSSNGQIWKYDNNNGWERIEGHLKHVSVGDDGTVVGVNDANEILFYDTENKEWKAVCGSLNYISVGSADKIWGVNKNGNIFKATKSVQSTHSEHKQNKMSRQHRNEMSQKMSELNEKHKEEMSQKMDEMSKKHMDQMNEQNEKTMNRMNEIHKKHMDTFNEMSNQQNEHMNDMKMRQNEHMNKMQTMHNDQTEMLKDLLNEQRKDFGNEMKGMKESLFEQMQNLKNEKLAEQRQKEESMKQRENALNIEHEKLEKEKEQKLKVENEQKALEKHRVEWEEQRKERMNQRENERDLQRDKLMEQRQKLRESEHLQLMNGLKGFLTAFKTLSDDQIEKAKATQPRVKPPPKPQPQPPQQQPQMFQQGPMIPLTQPQILATGQGMGPMMTMNGDRIDIYHRHPFNPQMLNNMNALAQIPGLPMMSGSLPIGFETEQHPHVHMKGPPPPPPLMPPIPPLPPGMGSRKDVIKTLSKMMPEGGQQKVHRKFNGLNQENMDEQNDENGGAHGSEMSKMGEQIGKQIQNQLLKMEQRNMRRLISGENGMNIFGFRKCIFYNNRTSKVCVGYNYLNQLLFVDVLMTNSDIENDKNIFYFVEEHEIENNECVKIMQFEVCMDGNNEFLIRDNAQNILKKMHWSVDNEWNQITKFDGETNQIQKCMKLHQEKLHFCVLNTDSANFVIQIKIKM